MQQQMLDDIKTADASAIDAVYNVQKAAHRAALALPFVQKHIGELDKMPM